MGTCVAKYLQERINVFWLNPRLQIGNDVGMMVMKTCTKKLVKAVDQYRHKV